MKLNVKDKYGKVEKSIDVEVSDTFFTKLKGLMFKKEIINPMVFYKCKQVHTFFMKVPIDIYYFDENMKIIECEINLEPNRIGKYVKKGFGVIETKSKLNFLKKYDYIELVKNANE